MSATLFGRGLIGSNQFGFQYPWGASFPYPVTHPVIFNSRTIYLAWKNITQYTPEYYSYTIQVSLNPDFSGTDVYLYTTLRANCAIFTDNAPSGARRYWRWRWTVAANTVWSPWSPVGSYWLDTSASEQVILTRNTWALINPSTVSDRFNFEIFPLHRVTQQNMFRVRNRNRAGILLSEYLTSKATIELTFDEERYLRQDEFAEIRRFHETVKTFYLAMFHDFDLGNAVPNIWKVQLTDDPALSMFTAGRQDLFTGVLNFEEV